MGRSHPLAYLHPRDPQVLHERLSALMAEYTALSRTSVQRRIALAHRIGCLRYALGYDDVDVMSAFQDAAEAIPSLLRHGSVEPSLAIACWGIAAIAQRGDLIEALRGLDPECLGSQHGIPRYMRMLISIFSAMQHLSLGVFTAVQTHIADYDREFARKRVHRMAASAFGGWTKGLRDLLDAACLEYPAIENAITQRCTYLDDSYRSQTDLLDHEGLLDVHGLGILTAASLSGLGFQQDGIALPIRLIAGALAQPS